MENPFKSTFAKLFANLRDKGYDNWKITSSCIQPAIKFSGNPTIYDVLKDESGNIVLEPGSSKSVANDIAGYASEDIPAITEEQKVLKHSEGIISHIKAMYQINKTMSPQTATALVNAVINLKVKNMSDADITSELRNILDNQKKQV